MPHSQQNPLGHIPAAGESFEHDGLKVTIDNAEKTKLVKVTVEKFEEQPTLARDKTR